MSSENFEILNNEKNIIKDYIYKEMRNKKMSIKIKTLDSGITILSDQFKSKTLSFGMWLNVGSVNEKKESIWCCTYA